MSPATVLVVEDDPLDLKLVRDVRGHAGYRVLEAVARLRADPRTAGIPVVALTAGAMKQDGERFIGAGFDGYLEKPVSVPALPGQIPALIGS